MNTTQRVIKYIAMAFALGLALFIILMVVNGVFFGMSLLDNILGRDGGLPSDGVYDYSQSFSDVRSLEIDHDVGLLTIIVGDEFRVDAKNEDRGISVELKDGTLKVKNKKDFGLFNWGGDQNRTIITIPGDFVAEEVELETGAGKVSIERLAAKEMDIKTGAGSFTAKELKSDRAHIEGGVGEVVLRDVDLRNLELECGVGSLSLTGNVTGTSKVNCGVGETRLKLTGARSDYRLNLDVGIGAIHVDGEKQGKGSYGDSSAQHTLTVEGGVGSVHLDFGAASSLPDQVRHTLFLWKKAA